MLRSALYTTNFSLYRKNTGLPVAWLWNIASLIITVRPFINISINGFSFPRRDTGASVRGAQPVDVGSVAAVGDMRITGGGRSLVRDATVAGG